MLFLNYEYPPLGGGAGNASKHILEEYAHFSDIQVDFVTSAIGDAYEIEMIGERIRIHKLPIGKNHRKLRYQSHAEILKYTWKSYYFSKQLLQSERFDVLHAFFGIPCGYVAMKLGNKFKIPYIVSLRGADVPGYSERFSFLYKIVTPLITRVWKRASRVVSNSKGLRTLALTSNSNQPIDIIYNGVDTKTFFPKQESKSVESKEVVLLCASRLSRRKGFKYVVDALHLLRSRYPTVRLLIAGGEGDAEAELRQQVKSLNLSDRVEFFGEYNAQQLVHIQQRSDIFILPSFNEGMSNNILEALASGLPVIMTPTGGAEELIREGENGYIVRFGDAQDIAEKIERLLINLELCQRMSRQSRIIAESMSWKNVAESYIHLYQNVKSETMYALKEK